MASLDELTGLVNTIGAVQGQDQTTRRRGTQTQTQQTQLSNEAVQQLVNDILAGPGGVRSIGGAARSAGIFDSPTEELLLGDLYSRAATRAETARAPTTTTTRTDETATVQQPGIGLGGLGTALAGTAALSPVVEGLSGAVGDLGIGEGISQGVQNVVSGLFGGGGGQAAGQTAGAALGGQAGGLSTGAIQAAQQVAGGAGGAAGGGILSGISPGIGAAGGGLVSGLLGGREAATEPSSLITNAALGGLAAGPAGLVAAPVASLVGGLFSDSVSIICTALKSRGLLDEELYAAGHKYLQSLPEHTKTGYYKWAVPIAHRIYAGSKFWTAVCLPFARSRTTLIASRGTVRDHVCNPLGTITKFIGEPICYFIGKTSSFKNYEVS